MSNPFGNYDKGTMWDILKWFKLLNTQYDPN